MSKIAVPPFAPSVVIVKTCGEYRVAFRAAIVRDAGEREASAYYTNDLEDALVTAERMHSWMQDRLSGI